MNMMERTQRYMDEIIEVLKGKSPKEVLSYAIVNEEEEARYYRQLERHARRGSVKILFRQMAEESDEHRDNLYKLFKKLYPDEEPASVEAPPVEVAPFYPEFETAEDYLEALEYCMKSELFAKETYELLAQKATDDESRAIFARLAEMEEDHYRRIKKVYDLLMSFKARKLLPENLEPGGYLVQDKTKGRYIFADLIERGSGTVISRDPPKILTRWFGMTNLNVVWLSNTTVKGAMNARELVESRDLIAKVLERGEVLLLENVEYIALSEGFKRLMEYLSFLRDVAITSGSHMIVHAGREAFDTKEWAVLRAEFEEVD